MSSVVALEPVSAWYRQRAEGLLGPLLLLGVGDGAVACALARRADVVAVEASTRLLELTIDRGTALVKAGKLRLVQADPRSWRDPRRFAAAFLPQNSAGLMDSQEDLDALLATLSAHLEAGAPFALDVRVGPSVARQPRGAHLEDHSRREAKSVVHPLRVRVARPQDIDRALAKAGLAVQLRLGDFDGQPAAEDAEAYIVAGVKGEGA